jgi:hypothetical protein
MLLKMADAVRHTRLNTLQPEEALSTWTVDGLGNQPEILELADA